jgi:hypothetical protein
MLFGGDIIAVNCKSSGYIEACVIERQREPRRGNFVISCKCIATGDRTRAYSLSFGPFRTPDFGLAPSAGLPLLPTHLGLNRCV